MVRDFSTDSLKAVEIDQCRRAVHGTLRAMDEDRISITSVNSRLRAIRQSQGLSLMDIENMSKGRIKAVVLGSYERGSRSLSVRRAIEIAELLQVPVASLFSEKLSKSSATSAKLILDLRALSKRVIQGQSNDIDDFALLARFTRSLVQLRQDWNGEVISMRECDLETLSVVLNRGRAELVDWLDTERILLRNRNRD